MSMFALHDEAVLRDIIAAHPLAALVTAGPEGLDARHIPLLLRAGNLVGHMARANPLAARDGAEVLAIFRAAEAYVSPNLYASKAEHGRVVPTWNYVVAHAHGRLRIIDDPAWVRAQIGELTDSQEGGRAHPWKVEDAPADYIEKMQRGIIGLEIAITRLAGVRKASQNREERDRAGVRAGLAADARPGAAEMAAWVREGPAG
jgi:transcriptional regulator